MSAFWYIIHTLLNTCIIKKKIKKTVYGNIILYSEYKCFKLAIKRKKYKNTFLKKSEIEK